MNHHVQVLMRGLRHLEPVYVETEHPEMEDDEITFPNHPDFSIQVGLHTSPEGVPEVGLDQWVDERTALLHHGHWLANTPGLQSTIWSLVEPEENS